MGAEKAKQWFFKSEQMDFELQCILGGCYFGSADAGEVLMTAGRIRSGDAESWVHSWLDTAERVHGYAEESAASGNDVSAGQAFLRAAGYYAATLSMIDGTDDPGRGVEYWKRHIACFDEFCARLVPPAERVEIPYGNTPMPGYFFKPDGTGGPWATIIFNNGSDGPTASMWGSGVSGALKRGYAALVFDGPGQNAMLWMHGVPFRPDWEKVISPVVDLLSARPDVDPGRIALSGISQGGYWILRALAFEHRIAAGIADPGVIDVSTAITGRFPRRLVKLLESGNREEFEREMAVGARMMGQEARRTIAWRMKPYGTDSYYRWLKSSMEYNVRDVIGRITCPMFIADPDDEQFWPGQPKQVYDALTSPKTLARFTREEGANWHCEPKARALYDMRMFDWLATVMPA